MNLINQRSRLRAYLDDGLFEMALATALAALGSWFLLKEMMYMAWLMPWMFMTLILPASKKKVAGPRGGVVDFPRPQGAKGLRMMLVLGLAVFALVGLVLATATARESAWFRPIAAGIQLMADHFALMLGLVFAVVLAKLGYQGLTPRLLWFAGLCLAAGIVADLLIPSGRMGALATGWAVGVPLWISGYVHYRRFVDAQPPIEDTLPLA